MFGAGSLKPTTPVIRTEVRKVTSVSSNGSVAQSRPSVSASRPQPRTAPKGPPPNRFQLSRPASRPAAKPQRSTAQDSRKRKTQSPAAIAWGDSESSQSDSEEEQQKKKAKRLEEPLDPDRRTRDSENWATGAAHEFDLIHGRDVTLDKYAKDFVPFFDEEEAEVSLQYPSTSQQERFRIVRARERDAYDPSYDVRETIRIILQYYLPKADSEPFLDESTGVLRKLRRGLEDKNLLKYRAAVDDFNTHIRSTLNAGTIATKIDELPRLPLPLIDRILTQVYSRTVSPRINELRAYAAGSDNVYGELQYPFCSQIFRDTKLKSTQTFLDLGSGVGNVVLQAALEVGCESWGIEMMPAACSLADAQAKEFTARARMWGLHVGSVNLLSGDIFKHPDLHAVLRRADVVLVNNQAFQPETNAKLLHHVLLDLKDGAKLVSLKNFGPDFKLTQRTVENPVACFEMESKRFYQNWVSWTHVGGEYTVATKDSARIARFLAKHGQSS